MVDLKKLDELKDKLATADSFADVMEFFFDHFAENPEFRALGKWVKSPLMSAVIQRVGEGLLGTDVRVTAKRFVLLKKQRFLHGAAHLNGRMAVLFFFKDIDMGMLCCQVGAESRFARFTSHQLDTDEPPVLPPKSSKLVH